VPPPTGRLGAVTAVSSVRSISFRTLPAKTIVIQMGSLRITNGEQLGLSPMLTKMKTNFGVVMQINCGVRTLLLAIK
jgi:hypothetical protein